MTLTTHLQFGDNITGQYTRDYLVVKYHNNISRAYTALNPHSQPKDTDIEVTIVSPKKEDMTLYEWFADNTMVSGRLLFEIMDVKSSDGVIQRSLYFNDAQCVSLQDTFDISAQHRRQLTLRITPAKVKIEGVAFPRDGVVHHDPHHRGGFGQGKSIHDDDVMESMDKYNAKYDF